MENQQVVLLLALAVGSATQILMAWVVVGLLRQLGQLNAALRETRVDLCELRVKFHEEGVHRSTAHQESLDLILKVHLQHEHLVAALKQPFAWSRSSTKPN